MRSTLRSLSGGTGGKEQDLPNSMKLPEIRPLSLEGAEMARDEGGLVVPLPVYSQTVSPKTSVHGNAPQKVVFRELITGKRSRNSGLVQFDKHYSLT